MVRLTGCGQRGASRFMFRARAVVLWLDRFAGKKNPAILRRGTGSCREHCGSMLQCSAALVLDAVVHVELNRVGRRV